MNFGVIIPYLLLALGILFTVIYVREKLEAYTIKAVLLKTTCSVFFMGIAVSSAVLNWTGAYSALVIIGLLFGLLGDIWLDLKYVYRDDDTIYTFSGFTVFAIGHVFFLSALLLRFADFSKPWYLIIPAIIGLIIGFGAIAIAPIMKLDYGKFANITKAYGSLLGAFAALSGSLAIMNGFKVLSLDVMFIGAVMFLLSDLVLSGTYFGGKERPIDIKLNYIFYYGGQFLIALSLLYA